MKKNLLRRNGILFLLVFAFTVIGAFSVCANTTYSDLKNTHWAYDNILKMSDLGIVKGYPDGTFKPSNKVTYAEFIKMCDIAVLKKDSGSALSGHWATNYYNDAIAAKLFTSNDIPKEKLNKEITRGDMALIISNSFENKITTEDTAKLKKKISDLSDSGVRQEAVIRAYGLGIITGYVDGTFRPNVTLNRAEACAVIIRITDSSKRIYPNLEEVLPSNKLSSLISNLSEYPDLNYKNTYTLDNATKYNMKLSTKNGYKWFEHTMKGYVWLVKDGKIIERTNTSPTDTNGGRASGYETDITKVDYIVSGNMYADYEIIVVQNPFKK